MSKSSEARQIARTLYDVALGAVDARLRVRRALEIRTDLRDRLESAPGRLVVVGFGKAVVSMARGLCDGLSRRADAGVLIAPDAAIRAVGKIEVHAGGHPTPTDAGVAAAGRMADLLAGLGPDDAVLALVSGGGSSLGALPAEGVTLEELVARTDALLKSGAPIDRINAERGRMTRFANGGLAALAAPAPVVALVLSDVPGDNPAVVACGPTVGGPEGHACDTLLVGCNATARHAAASFAGSLGLEVEIGPELSGPAGAAGTRIGNAAREAEPGTVSILGGETTVHVTGAGIGGRNQELALAAAIALHGVEGAAVLAGGTDGIDGPTEAAGAIVDGGTFGRILEADIDPAVALFENDSATALAAAGDQLVTGPTGTNVADLVIRVTL